MDRPGQDFPGWSAVIRVLTIVVLGGSLLWHQVKTQDVNEEKFKLLVVSDSGTEGEMFSEYMNESAKYVSNSKLVYQEVRPNEDSIDSAYQEICGILDDGIQFIISIATKKAVLAAVARVARISQVPTVQVDYNPWAYPKTDTCMLAAMNNTNTTDVIVPTEASSGSNFISVVPTTTVFMSVLREMFVELNVTQNVMVLFDDQYSLNKTGTMMLAKSGVSYRRKMMATNASEIPDQLIQLQAERVEVIVLMCTTKHAETYMEAANTQMEKKRFKWIFMSRDIQAFQCEPCTTVETIWVRPQLYEGNQDAIRISSFKEWLRTQEENDIISQQNEAEAAFYLDLVRMAWAVMLQNNETMELFPVYGCYNYSFAGNNTVALTEFLASNMISTGGAFEGSYGTFEPYDGAKYYHNVEIRIMKLQFDKDARYMKMVGNWTALGGISTAFASGLYTDVKEIKFYRITIVEQPPFIEKVKAPNGTFFYRGYCIDLIEKIKLTLEFTYELYEVKDKTYGAINEKGEWNGLIKELIDGNAEIALAPLSVMAERENYVDFTVPYYDLVGTTILMKKSEPDYSLFKFMTVLEAPVWGCIVGAYFFTSFLLWIFDKFSPYSYTNNKEKYKDDPEKREFTLKECLWFCMTSLTPQGGGEAPKNISGRLVAATWWLFGFIIIASYTANLAAFLTVSRLETPISSLDDLAKQYKIKYAPVKGTASEVYFKRMAEIEDRFYDIWKAMSLNESMTPQERAQLAVWDYPVSDKFTNMWRYMKEAGLPNTTEEAIARVLTSPNPTEGFAFIGDATEIRYAELTNCKLQQVGNEFSRKPYAIAVQQGSPLKDKISGAILRLLNQRELEHFKEKWWNQNPNKKDCPKNEDEADGISIQNIGGVFIVILVGIALSIITLAFEYWYYKDRRQPGDPAPSNGDTGHINHGDHMDHNHLANNHVTTTFGDEKDINGINANGVITMGHYNMANDIKD